MMIMDMEEAYRAVRDYGEMQGHYSIWSAVKSMENNWDDLDSYDRTAYKMVNRELANLVSVTVYEEDGAPD
jgi:hypothetical protein